VLALASGLACAQGTKAPQAQGQPQEVALSCEAAYLPARTTWTRLVNIGYDQQRVRTVQIDGVPVHTFNVRDTVILTSIDNERIQIDTATQTWTSDFRGLATSQGRCLRR
jgi:N6-adenosine-specific RNA methylase IME4